jgi:hypothetical protein
MEPEYEWEVIDMRSREIRQKLETIQQQVCYLVRYGLSIIYPGDGGQECEIQESADVGIFGNSPRAVLTVHPGDYSVRNSILC